MTNKYALLQTYRDWLMMSMIMLAFSLTGCNTQALSDQPVVLRFPLTPGQQYTKVLEMTSNMRLPIGIPNADYRHSVLTAHCRVLDYDAQAGGTIEVTLTSLQAEMKSLGVRAEFDSTAPPADLNALDDKQKRFYDTFQGIIGTTYTVKIDGRGKTQAVTGLEGTLKQAMLGTIEGSLGQDQLVLLFNKENLQDIALAPCFATVTDPMLDPNDTWQDQQYLRIPRALDIPANRTYTFEKVTQDGQHGPIAVITYHSVLKEEPAQSYRQEHKGTGKYGMIILQGATRGTIEYALKTGQIMKQTEKGRTEISTTQLSPRKNNGKRKNQIFYDIEREIRLQ